MSGLLEVLGGRVVGGGREAFLVAQPTLWAGVSMPLG